MIETYFKHEQERQQQGIPPLPLTPEQTAKVCQFLQEPTANQEQLYLHLLKQRVAPGVDPAAKVKAEWLEKVAKQEQVSPVVSPQEAVFLLDGTLILDQCRRVRCRARGEHKIVSCPACRWSTLYQFQVLRRK